MRSFTLQPDSRQSETSDTAKNHFQPSPLNLISAWLRLGGLLDWLGRQHQRSQGRRQLLTMSEQQLKDIGLSRGTAFSEATRHFWE